MNIIDDDELTFTDGGIIADNISGTGHVTFTGFNQYIITGNLTQTGGTTIHEGAILVGNGIATGFIGGDIVSGVATDNGSISTDRSDNITVSGNISGLGYLAQYGTGTLTLTGNNAYGACTLFARYGRRLQRRQPGVRQHQNLWRRCHAPVQRVSCPGPRRTVGQRPI